MSLGSKSNHSEWMNISTTCIESRCYPYCIHKCILILLLLWIQCVIDDCVEYVIVAMFCTINIFEHIFTSVLFWLGGVMYDVLQILRRSNSCCELEDVIEAFFVYLSFSVILVSVALICNTENESFVNVLDYLI